MRIAVLCERMAGERRVALTPEAAQTLVSDGHSVVVESGAGVAAGMSVVAVATPFTECGLYRELPVPEEWVVRESDELAGVVRRRIDEHNRSAHTRETS